MRRSPSLLPCCLLAAVSLASGGCGIVHDRWNPPVPSPTWTSHTPLRQTGGAETAAATQPTTLPAGPVQFTVEEAVLRALENNRALHVQRLSPRIQATFIEQELAAFDPVLSAQASAARQKSEARGGGDVRESVTGAGLGVSRALPTGTTVGAGASTERTWGNGVAQQHATRVGLSVTQALLRGRGVAVNLANLRQARLDALLSEYEFRGFVEALVAEVETTYWQYVLAKRQVSIVQESLSIAQKQLEDTGQRIRVGTLAETELAAAEAELALRRESLINARSRADALRVRLLRLVYPQLLSTATRELIARTEPTIPPLPLESLQDHVALALRSRPELNQAELLIERGELEVVKTRNGLLPRMDLFATLGATGYADSFSRSAADVTSDGYDVLVGLSVEYPLANRDARARHERAVLTRTQREQAMGNLRDLIRQDVELAFIEVRRARQQVDATTATRKAQQEKVRVETAKYAVGKSTALLVAAAQRDLLASQVAEVEAATNYINARIVLYRLEGSLLARRGLGAPGAANGNR